MTLNSLKKFPRGHAQEIRMEEMARKGETTHFLWETSIYSEVYRLILNNVSKWKGQHKAAPFTWALQA